MTDMAISKMETTTQKGTTMETTTQKGTTMTDIDQTNIYSYHGPSFMLDFEKYLFDHGITVDEIELMNGMIGIWLAGSQKPVMVMQDAQWADVVSKLATHV